MIDEGDYIQMGILVVALIGAINWGVFALQGKGLIQMVLNDAQTIDYARMTVGAAGLIIVTEAFEISDVTDIGWGDD